MVVERDVRMLTLVRHSSLHCAPLVPLVAVSTTVMVTLRSVSLCDTTRFALASVCRRHQSPLTENSVLSLLCLWPLHRCWKHYTSWWRTHVTSCQRVTLPLRKSIFPSVQPLIPHCSDRTLFKRNKQKSKKVKSVVGKMGIMKILMDLSLSCDFVKSKWFIGVRKHLFVICFRRFPRNHK